MSEMMDTILELEVQGMVHSLPSISTATVILTFTEPRASENIKVKGRIAHKAATVTIGPFPRKAV